jgi:hypothetical protein
MLPDPVPEEPPPNERLGRNEGVAGAVAEPLACVGLGRWLPSGKERSARESIREDMITSGPEIGFSLRLRVVKGIAERRGISGAGRACEDRDGMGVCGTGGAGTGTGTVVILLAMLLGFVPCSVASPQDLPLFARRIGMGGLASVKVSIIVG